MALTTPIHRKSVKLSKEQKRALVCFVGKHHTFGEACQELDLAPNTLRRIMAANTAHSLTIEKIFSIIPVNR